MTDAWRAKQFEALCEKYSLTWAFFFTNE
jgi:hypothetical protein